MRVWNRGDRRLLALRRRARALEFVSWMMAVAFFLAGSIARAEAPLAPTTLRVQVANCDAGFTARMPALIKLEIDVLLRERGPTRAPPETIAVRCGDERARIEITMEGSSRASTIDLHALAPEHRARAIALAAAELVHAMSGRPRVTEQPVDAPAPPSMQRTDVDRRESDASTRSSSRPALWLGGLAEWRGNPAAILLGGRLAFQYPVNEIVLPELSVDASFGALSATSARIAIQSFSIAAHLYFGMTTGSVRWDLGPGARVGSVKLTGQPDAGSSLQGETLPSAWGGPELRMRAAYRPSQLRPALFALQLGAGYVALPVRGLLDGTQPIYAVEGPWMSVCIEAGLGI